MAEKPAKFGFSIKLSDETSEKLKSEVAPQPECPPEPMVQSEEENVDVTPEINTEISSDKKNGEKIETVSESSTIADETTVSKAASADDGNLTSNEALAQYVHYEGSEALYTDPATGHQYVWSAEKNEWTPRSLESGSSLPNPDGVEDGRKYSFENNVHTYTDSDGSSYFWDEEKKAWFPKVDEDFLAHYQMAYGFVDNTSISKTDDKSKPDGTPETKIEPVVKKPPEEPKWFDMPEDQNNKVYVSNLPLDLTEEEFVDVMQKCGLVMRDQSSQKMKIKLYNKPNSNQFKGDALCTYIKIESVELALNILDGYTIRNHRIKVQRAKFQMKGDFNPSLKPKKKKKKDREKLKKMQERLFDWRPEKMRGERSKHERIVIIKNLFEPSLFDAEVHLILEYQQDMREECSKCGEVKKVFLYDRHPDGVCQVTMKEPEEAESVVKLINGRWFGKRQLTAEIWDGKTKYKMEETDADLNKRIDGWNKFLEEEPETK